MHFVASCVLLCLCCVLRIKFAHSPMPSSGLHVEAARHIHNTNADLILLWKVASQKVLSIVPYQLVSCWLSQAHKGNILKALKVVSE